MATSALPGVGQPAAHGWPALRWIPLVLAIAMEAAWVSVIAGLVQELALDGPVLEFAGMAGFVTFGVLAARFGETRLTGRWPAIGTALVFASAILGMLVSPAARDAFASGHPGDALSKNPGGLVAGLAVLRGYAHAGRQIDVDTVARAIFLGVPLLAVVAAIGGMVVEPWRSMFLRGATIDAGVFVVAGLLALAIAALIDVRPAGAAGWRANPVWVAMVLLAIGALLAIAIPIGLAGGGAIAFTIQVVVAASMVPFSVVALIIEGRAAIRRMRAVIVGGLVLIWLLSFAPQSTSLGGAGGTAGTDPVKPTLSPAGVVGITGVTLLIIGVILFLLIAAWMRRHEGLPEDLADVRSHDLPGEADRDRPAHRQRRRPWTAAPRTATEAYLALVDDLHDQPVVRRAPTETPAEHARRLRANPLEEDIGLGLDFLAADYGLASYGGRAISIGETRRAIGRWRLLRRRLRLRPPETLPEAAAARAETPSDQITDLRSH